MAYDSPEDLSIYCLLGVDPEHKLAAGPGQSPASAKSEG